MTTPNLFIDPQHMTPFWLTDRLRRNGHLSQGEVVSVQVKAHPHRRFVSITVTYSSDAPESLPKNLLLKRHNKGYAFGVREGDFYLKIAPQMPVPLAPPCYDVAIDYETGQTAILMEDLSATHFVAMRHGDKLSREIFEQIVDVYLQLHTHWWEHARICQDDILEPRGIGMSHEATSSEAILENGRYFAEKAWPRWVDQFADQFPREWRELCEKAIASWANLFIQRTKDGKALTLIQGDAHIHNVLLPHNPQLHRPVIIDWEGCVRGIGVWDLARMLIDCRMPPDMRVELESTLLSRYHARLVESGIENYTLQECYDDYRLCLLANIPHTLVWGDLPYLESTIHAIKEWECEELLD